jgi:hypothetical protein
MLCFQNSDALEQFYKGLNSKYLGLETTQNSLFWYENYFATHQETKKTLVMFILYLCS